MRGDAEEEEWRRGDADEERSLRPVGGDEVYEEEKRGGGGAVEVEAEAEVANARQATQARLWRSPSSGSSTHGGVLRLRAARRLIECGGRAWTARRGCSHPICGQLVCGVRCRRMQRTFVFAFPVLWLPRLSMERAVQLVDRGKDAHG